MPLTPLAGPLGIKRAAHLLRRAGFGGTKQQIDNFSTKTASDAVQILFGTAIPDVPPPKDPQTEEEWISTNPSGANSRDRDLIKYFKSWFIGQMLSSGITNQNQKLAYAVREKITLFLHTHFTTMQEKVDNSRALYFQNALFRLFALDKEDDTVEIEDEDTGIISTEIAPRNFKELTKKMCVDNAMLIFLDGRQNVKGSPNENYAREMFELYTIGRGLEERVKDMAPSDDGDYFTFKEKDVQAAARVLTGFKFDENFSHIDPYTGLPTGIAQPGSHSIKTSEKEFSDYFNVTIDQDPLLSPGGVPNEESMLDEVSQLIDMIYDREETTKQICRKLYRFFVHYNISVDLDNTVIVDLAATFIANDYKIQPVLEELLASEHFYEGFSGLEDDKFGGIIKSPLDLILSAQIFMEVEIPDYENDLEKFYKHTDRILAQMSDQGMNFYEPYEVAGYGAYHQYPVYNRNWISTNYLTQRYSYIAKLLNGEAGDKPEGEEDFPPVDLIYFIEKEFDAVAPDARQLITALAPYLFPMADNLDFDSDLAGRGLSKERLRYFLQSFLQFGDYNDTAMVDQENTIWASFYNDPTKYDQTGTYLRRLFNAMLQTPEYQLF